MAPVQSRVWTRFPEEYHNKQSWMARLPPRYQQQVLGNEAVAKLQFDELVDSALEPSFEDQLSEPYHYPQPDPRLQAHPHFQPPPGFHPQPHPQSSFHPRPFAFHPPPPPPSTPPPPPSPQPPPPSYPLPPESSTPPPRPPSGLPPWTPGATHPWSESFRAQQDPSLNDPSFRTQASQWGDPPLNHHLQAPPPWRSHNAGFVPADEIAFSSQGETNTLRGQYLGYEIDVLNDQDYAEEFEITHTSLHNTDLYAPNLYNPAVINRGRAIEEVDEANLSEASTTIYQVDEPLDLSQSITTARRTEPPTEAPTYNEAMGNTASPLSRPKPEPCPAANKPQAPSTATEEKPNPSPFVTTRPDPESSNKGQGSRKKRGRKGKGQARKSKNTKPTMTFGKAQEPAAEPKSAASDKEKSQSARPDSPGTMVTQEFDTAGWTEVRRKDRKKKKGPTQQAMINETISAVASDSGVEQPPEVPSEEVTIPAVAEPAMAIAAPSPARAPVPFRNDLLGVPKATSIEAESPMEVIETPEVPAATSAESSAEEIRRAEEGQLDIQFALVREEETLAHVQQLQEHITPCVVDTERWRQRVSKRMAEETARQAEQAEKEEMRRWEVSYARRQRAQHPASYSQFSSPSEVASPRITIASASVLQSQQYSTPGPGQPVVQQAALNAERRGECGCFPSCCAHVPWWIQPDMGNPHGCCCNHAGVNCCLCRPPPRWGVPAPGVSLELVSPVVAASFPVPSFTGDFPIGQPQQPQLHWRPSVPAPPQTENLAVSRSLALPRLPISPPPRPPRVSLPSPPASLLRQLEQPAAGTTTTPTSPKMSAAEKSPSVASTVKNAPAASSPVQAQHAAHRVIPVIPLNFYRSADSQAKVSLEKITGPSSEEGSDMSTKAPEATSQDELAPSVASLFEHARQTAPVQSPAIQADPATTDSRPESPKEFENAQADDVEGLVVDKLRIAGGQVEPDLRSPSLYFDAKQQMSSSPAQSSESNSSPLRKSCLKAASSTPSPPGASPPRSSPPRSAVRFSDGTSPGNSPDTNIHGPDASPTPHRPRVPSDGSSTRSSEAKDAAGHVQSLWKNHEFADLQIVLTPYAGLDGPSQFQSVTATTFRVHKSIVSASPFLHHVMEFKGSHDGHVAVINVQAGPQFCSAYAFEKALSALYGMEAVIKETLRRVTLESIGREDDDGAGLNEDSLRIMQITFALCYASAGAFLARREITAEGIDLALDLLTWETAEYITAFGMTAYGWTLTCTDILTSPAGSPRSVNSNALDLGRAAEADFVHVWADLVRSAAFQFFARNMQPEFELYERAQSKHVPTRIPEPIWTLPGSLLSNPLLENLRFGEMPSYADRRPTRIDILIISGMLLSLPYGCFMKIVDMLKSNRKLTVGLLKEVVEKREERRLHALRVYHRRTWAHGDIDQYALDELAYREYVAGEPSEINNDEATALTSSVQRISVGLNVPNMNAIASRSQHGSDPAMRRPSTPRKQQVTAATTTQNITHNDTAEEGTDRGRQRTRRKNKKKKKAKKTQAGISTDPTTDGQGVQHG